MLSPAAHRHGTHRLISFFFTEEKKKVESAHSKKPAGRAYVWCLLVDSFMRSHLCQTSNLLDADVEPEQVQGLLAHSGQTRDRGASLFHEGKVSVDP